MESWMKILGIVEFVIVIIVLLFLIGVIIIISKNRNLEFNGYWKSRNLLVGSAFIWVLFLMLGNEYLWSSEPDSLFGMTSKHSEAICGLYVFFSVGFAEPLFFLVCLFTIKSKTNRDKDNSSNNINHASRSSSNHHHGNIGDRGKNFIKSRLNFEDPNNYVLLCSLVCTLPLIIIHIILLILDATNVSEPKEKQFLFTVYDNKCSVPIISTAAFAVFFVIFLLFFILISRNFSKTIINRSLINRIRLLQVSFIAFLPLEVAIRVVLIFTLKIGNTSQALFNAFFFVDIIVVLIGVLEFALFPILDSLGFYSSSIRFWRFKYFRNNNHDSITDGDGEYDNLIKDDGNNNNKDVPLKTISTNISSTTPSSLIPISDYEKSIKYSENSNNNNNNNGANASGYSSNDDDNQQYKQQKQSELEKLKIKHKSPILDRVRETEPISLPTEPLSSPLSSVSSTKSSNLEQTATSHERKKSRRFSLSSKKRSPSSSSSSPSPSNTTPLSQSPPQQSQPQNRYLQPTPVDDFKNNLFKYSQAGYK